MQAKIDLELCPIAGLPGFCWAWTGYRMPKGYGQVSLDGKAQLVHRVTYQLLVGPIPDELELDHLCQYESCCNPEHTEPVTSQVNSERTDAARKTHCVNRHPLSGGNLIIKRQPNGHTIRNCRTCANENRRRPTRQVAAA